MFQAAEADHQQHVTVVLCRSGLMASLSGNSCVWRRACMEDVGGLSSATMTEDVDLGYRAQLGAWKYAFLPNVVSTTELPATMSAFRVQRERWARGLVQNAARHARAMFMAPMSLTERMYAVSLMFSPLLLASFYPLILLALPVVLVTASLGPVFDVCCTVFLLTAIAWAWTNCAGCRVAAPQRRAPPLTYLLRAYAYVTMFFPMSLYYFTAAAQILAGLEGKFNRTPKGPGAAWEKRPTINGILFGLELLTLTYALATLICAVQRQNYWVCLFSGLVFSGFAITLLFSWQERRIKQT
jgi:cellulose synthase (UDP-forming)